MLIEKRGLEFAEFELFHCGYNADYLRCGLLCIDP